MSNVSPILEFDYPVEVAFLPYEGSEYQRRFCKHRVLLLGESHYDSKGEGNGPEVTRGYTREEFGDLAKIDGQKRLFPCLDQMLVGTENPTPEEAAAAWCRVAYINLSQRFAPNVPGRRSAPLSDLRTGEELLAKHVLPRLRPTVIVVLGRKTWRAIQRAKEVPDLEPYQAECVNRGGRRRYVERREIYRLSYEGGSAWMTWLYHHSVNIEHWSDRARALRHLLKLPPDS